MHAFPRGKHGLLSVYVPRKGGGFTQRSLGTSDPEFAKDVEAVLRRLKRRWRAWDVLDAIADKRVSWDDVVALADTGTAGLEALRSSLDDLPLADHVEPFLAALVADGKSTSTADGYRRQLVRYTTAHPRRSAFTPATVREFLRGRDVSPGTRRHELYAFRSFATYLHDAGLLGADQLTALRAMRPPKKNPPRIVYRDAETDAAICAAGETPEYRALFALIHGTGAEVSPALRLRRRHVRLDVRRVDVPGTKDPKRYRHDIALDAWAVPLIAPHLEGLHPDAPLFPGLSRSVAHKAYAKAREVVGVTDYNLRDARHSIAIRMRRADEPFEAIARQLGNTVAQVHATYAQFQPGDGPAPKSTTTDRTTGDSRRRRAGTTMEQAS